MSNPQLQPVGFGKRLAAHLADTGLISAVTIGFQFALGRQQQWLEVLNTKSVEELTALNANMSQSPDFLPMILLSVAYFVLSWVGNDGATVGKKLMGIKVCSTDGQPISLPKALIRYFAFIFSSILLGLGHLSMIWDKESRALHDKIAGTRVVKSGGETSPGIVFLLATLGIVLNFFPMILGGYHGYQLATLQQQSKRASLTQMSRQELIDQLSPELREKFDHSSALFQQMKQLSQEDDFSVQALKLLTDENIAILKSALETEPDNLLLLSELYSAYTWPSSTDTSEARLEVARKTEAIQPENVIFINQVADALIDMGKNEEAILQLQKSFRLTDRSGYANMSAGTAYSRLKVKDKAVEHYQKAIAIFESENSSGNFDEEILSMQKALAELE